MRLGKLSVLLSHSLPIEKLHKLCSSFLPSLRLGGMVRLVACPHLSITSGAREMERSAVFPEIDVGCHMRGVWILLYQPLKSLICLYCYSYKIRLLCLRITRVTLTEMLPSQYLLRKHIGHRYTLEEKYKS